MRGGIFKERSRARMESSNGRGRGGEGRGRGRVSQREDTVRQNVQVANYSSLSSVTVCMDKPPRIPNTVMSLSADNKTATYRCRDGYETSFTSPYVISCSSSDPEALPLRWPTSVTYSCLPGKRR